MTTTDMPGPARRCRLSTASLRHGEKVRGAWALAILVAAATGLILSCGGCAAPSRIADAPPADVEITLSEGYTLLHDVVNSNRNVHQIFMIKGGSDEFKLLIRAIAAQCAQATAAIEAFANDDPMLSIQGANLPWIEAATRAAIESSASADLLGASGLELQKRLSLEQIEATRYLAHLSGAIAQIETNDARAAYLRGLSEKMLALRGRLIESLQPVTPPPSADEE